jgi:hypothetical protein
MYSVNILSRIPVMEVAEMSVKLWWPLLSYINCMLVCWFYTFRGFWLIKYLKHKNPEEKFCASNIQFYVDRRVQLDVTQWFIELVICSTCFGHYYVYHQELETIHNVTVCGTWHCKDGKRTLWWVWCGIVRDMPSCVVWSIGVCEVSLVYRGLS